MIWTRVMRKIHQTLHRMQLIGSYYAEKYSVGLKNHAWVSPNNGTEASKESLCAKTWSVIWRWVDSFIETREWGKRVTWWIALLMSLWMVYRKRCLKRWKERLWDLEAIKTSSTTKLEGEIGGFCSRTVWNHEANLGFLRCWRAVRDASNKARYSYNWGISQKMRSDFQVSSESDLRKFRRILLNW